ncbi:sodium-dependent transporter [Streptococcus pneumoniae]|uniref:Transporter n=4 Tax=Streptococcus pneumoniae TaxID=1313 RepID=A0A4G1VKM2_STREE|nr:sodium-dependent transporter [Streptococcus pneumoniae]ACO22522.1 sodium-dependent transporter [Streptococcus pneumoniae Taiwan19F-14]ADI69249.1 Sodium:neurotransmitter symporter family protein [Streptococcus pneumoniae TCH8431/19A]AGZ47467.1 sodium-dependent transporter [Streptococcus pneumoniae A026]APJ32199.1 Na+-dependent transporters of the SNF family protein [Streptococcus pneumoniae]APJ34224.1 NSS family amino acid:sodium (Na+) symporter [Streptococcus pneumoniae]
MVFLTDLRKHNRIVKSINQTEGYLTTQVAFSYFEKGDQSLTMSEKSQWGSKLGFILASAGSVIGLGSVWKFPYMTAANGGGGFLLIFLISTILIGFPLLLAEFALGRSAGVSAIKTFGKLGKNNKYNFIGWIGAFALFILLSFYSVIGGWILVYLGIEFGKLFQLGGTGDYAQLFTSIISNPAIALVAQAAFILLNIFIVSRGVQKGIERASKVMMPLLFIIFVVIIGRSLSLPNAMEGVLYFLKPDFSKLTSAGLLYALGQSFFALSLGVTVMMPLLFIVLPQLFDKMPFGTIFYVLFLFATVTSSVVMLEINVGNITNQDNSKRAKWSVILGILTFVFGIPSALSYGVMADVHIFGKIFFDAMDFLASNLLMPFGALYLSLFTGYIFKKALAMEELHLDERAWKQGLFQVWLFLLRFFVSSFQSSSLWSSLPNLCNQKGLE